VSPIIRVSDNESPIRQAITKEFFRIVSEKSDDYELFLSPVTLEELERTESDEKRLASAEFLKSIVHTKLPKNDEAEDLALVYVNEDVLSLNHLDDLRHVAYAVFSHCDYIITWNMRHLANEKTVSRVNAVNVAENYGKIYIATPEFCNRSRFFQNSGCLTVNILYVVV
jgi:predicted nucleic acid-binding protein